MVFTPVRLAQMTIDPRDGTAVVVLEHAATGAAFPIWGSDDEARALAEVAQASSDTSRAPRSSELLHGVISALGGHIREARITEITSLVLRAEIVIVHGDEERVLSARASDAIALALRAGAPVVVENALLDLVAARVREACAVAAPTTMTGAEHRPQSTAERWNQLIAHLSSTRPSCDASEM
jgi:bifunctional DNase/RNase